MKSLLSVPLHDRCTVRVFAFRFAHNARKQNRTQRKMITSGIEHSTNCFTRGTVKCFRHVFKLPKAFSSRRAAVFEAKKNGSGKAAERTSRDAQ